MADNSYDEILGLARQLTVEEQAKLVGELAQLAGRRNGEKHSILELEGLGKEVWEGIDPDKYVEDERNSWDG